MRRDCPKTCGSCAYSLGYYESYAVAADYVYPAYDYGYTDYAYAGYPGYYGSYYDSYYGYYKK